MAAFPPMPRLFDELPRSHYAKQWKSLKAERERYEPIYQDLADYIMPFVGRRRENERTKYGQARSVSRPRPMVINNKATMAQRTLVNNLMAGATSPSRQWFTAGLGDPALMKDHQVKAWAQGVTKTLLHIMSISNYYSAQRTIYRDLAVFGTGVKVNDEHDENVLQCHNIANGAYVLDTNEDGQVNRLMYELEMSVDAMVSKFGYDRVSKRVQWAYDQGNFQHTFMLVRVIEPNRLFQEDTFGLRGMKFVSLYYETDCDKDWNSLLGMKGYYERPFSAARWDLLADDVYGVSPGMETLGDIKGLQQLELRKAQAVDKQVTPPTQGPSSTNSGGRIRHNPGAHTSVSDASGNGIRALYEVKPDMISLSHEIARHEARIGEGFYENALQAILALGDTPNVKAAQIDGMKEEKMMAFGPVLERMFGELLDSDIARIFSIAKRSGLIPPPPEAVGNRPVRITYTSPFALLQKAVGIGNIERSVSFAGQVAAVYPEAADKIDPDGVIDEYFDAIGTPSGMTRSAEAIEALRKGRQQQIAAQKAAETVAAGAEVAKTASETQITSPSMLSYLIGGAGS